MATKRWLEGRSEPESFDVEGAAGVDEGVLDRKLESKPRAAVLWQGEQSDVIRGNELRAGQTIVVPSSCGGIEHRNWAPASESRVKDVAEFAALSVPAWLQNYATAGAIRGRTVMTDARTECRIELALDEFGDGMIRYREEIP